MSLKFGQRLSVEERRAEVSRRATQGESLRFMANELAVSVATIRKDLTAVRDEWRESAKAAAGERVASQLATLETIRREAFAAFERSKAEEIETVTVIEYEVTPGADGKPGTRKPVAQRTTRYVRQRLPDAKYLDTVLRTMEREAKLLGLDKATGKTTIINNGSGPVIAIDVAKMSDAELEMLDRVASVGVIEHKPPADAEGGGVESPV